MANEVMCPYCGEMISEKATVCRHCGRMLTGSIGYNPDGTGAWYGDTPDEHTGEGAERLRRRSRRTLWLVIGLCALLFAGMIAAFGLLAVDLAQDLNDSDIEDVDQLIESITGSGMLPESVLPDGVTQEAGDDDIAALPDLPGGVLTDQLNLVIDYVEALQKNDRDAAAALFHPAILEAYENDRDAMLTDMDEHLSEYGTKLSGWKLADSAEVEQDGIDEMNAVLPVSVSGAEAYLVELTPESGDVIEIYLLLVQTADGWSLYYSY